MSQSARSYTRIAISIAVAVLLVSGAINVISFARIKNTVTETSTETVTTTSIDIVSVSTESTTNSTSASIATTSISSNSSDGLQLDLSLKSHGGVNITITAYETNFLSSENNVTTADDWHFPSGLSPCGNSIPELGGNFEYSVPYPIALAVLQGNYGTNNYTEGAALMTYNLSQESTCPGVDLHVPYLIFAPNSDNASFPWGSYSVSDKLMTSDAGFQFSPGPYTVLAEDEWGNVLLLHFTVTS